jgi:hypothetical protein
LHPTHRQPRAPRALSPTKIRGLHRIQNACAKQSNIRDLAREPSAGTLTVHANNGARHQQRFSRAQAEGITEALKELDASSLATKTDLKDLKIRVPEYEAWLIEILRTWEVTD